MTRIVLFGATGYTGRLTAEAVLRGGQRPVLAGRSGEKLHRLAAELGGDMDVAVADSSRVASVEALVEPGDVLVSTVGPFAMRGDAAAEAAVRRCAHYLDCAGEPAFVRRVFERYGPAATGSRVAMLPAFGYEGVGGNLAGALALREAGPAAERVDTGYFLTGPAMFPAGTRASLAGAAVAPSFAYRRGTIRAVRGGDRYRKLPVAGTERPAISLGASDHFALPRSFPQLREVNAYLGWFGALSRPLHALSGVASAVLRIPGARAAYGAAAGRYVKRSPPEPDAAQRARCGSYIVALAYDGQGTRLAEVHLAGVDGWQFTAAILAWGAERLAKRGIEAAGALGPVEAFGLGELEAGCREAGLARVG